MGDPHKAKQRWTKKQMQEEAKKNASKVVSAEKFWNSEYETEEGKNFSLSVEPSEDLQKFVRWLERQFKGQNPINSNTFFIDVGCGNGRNSLWLWKEFGAKGLGYDISSVAIKKAENMFKEEWRKRGSGKILENMPLNFLVQNVNEKIPAEDSSADLVVDAVVTHVLRKEERELFKKEVLRVLSTGSYYFLKSLLLDDDIHAKNMIREFGANAGEANSYIHPTMGIFEHVPTEEELIEFYKDDFEIEKIERSHAHTINGRANKRRYIVMYLRKK